MSDGDTRNGETRAGLMTDTKPKTKLEALKEKTAKLQARINQIEARGKAENRKRDTRLKVIVGAACLADAAIHGDTKATVRAVIERAVKAPRDREFLKAAGWL